MAARKSIAKEGDKNHLSNELEGRQQLRVFSSSLAVAPLRKEKCDFEELSFDAHTYLEKRGEEEARY